MKSCRGCKHRIVAKGSTVCDAEENWRWYSYASPHDGKTYSGLRDVGVNAQRLMRPTIDEMRAPGARCGPDATLYEPTLRRRLWVWLFGPKRVTT